MKFITHVLLPILILAGGGVYSYNLYTTGPEPRQKKKTGRAITVEVEEIVPVKHTVSIDAMGEIIPAREIDLKSQVGGEITFTDREFLPGGFFKAGEVILKIDPTDYALVVKQLESEAQKTASDLLIEKGNQRIAQKEFALIGEKISGEQRDLILRKPQLEKLQAAKQSADARLEKARLDLQRTEVVAPFNCVIKSRDVNLGARISANAPLAHIVATDAFWLKVSIPIEKLKWIDFPQSSSEKGSTVTIVKDIDNTSVFWRGSVIRLLPSIEEKGRMAQLLVEVIDPFGKTEGNGGVQLLLGSYIRAQIDGAEIEQAFEVNRAHLHDGNTLWFFRNGKLEIREVVVVYRGKKQVIIQNGLESGELLITSSIPSPVDGLALRIAGQKSNKEMDVPEKRRNSSVKEGDTSVTK